MRHYLMLFLILPMPDMSLSLQVPCAVNLEEGVEYRKIMWYKVSVGSDSLVGLVMKDIRTNTTHLYKFANHSYQIGNDLSLLDMPEPSQECEIYRCCVWPPVGHRILQSDYSFPQGCQSNVAVKTEFSPQLQDTHVVQPSQSQCIIIAVVLILVFLAILITVYVFKRRKTHTRVALRISI